jgi:hypothetical protein
MVVRWVKARMGARLRSTEQAMVLVFAYAVFNEIVR